MKTESFTLQYTITPRLLAQTSIAWFEEDRSRHRLLVRLVYRFLTGLIMIVIMSYAIRLLTGVGYVPQHSVGATIGFFFGYLTFLTIARNSQKRFYMSVTAKLMRHGSTTAICTAEFVRFTDACSSIEHLWVAIDVIAVSASATVLRAGTAQYPIPNDALPEGLTPEAFRAQLQEWKDAKHEVFV